MPLIFLIGSEPLDFLMRFVCVVDYSGIPPDLLGDGAGGANSLPIRLRNLHLLLPVPQPGPNQSFLFSDPLSDPLSEPMFLVIVFLGFHPVAVVPMRNVRSGIG